MCLPFKYSFKTSSVPASEPELAPDCCDPEFWVFPLTAIGKRQWIGLALWPSVGLPATRSSGRTLGTKQKTMTLEQLLNLSDIPLSWLFFRNLKIKGNTFESQCFATNIKAACRVEMFCLLSFSLQIIFWCSPLFWSLKEFFESIKTQMMHHLTCKQQD